MSKIERSKVAFVDTNLTLFGYWRGAIDSEGSRLLFERVRFGTEIAIEPESVFAVVLRKSQALILDSAFRGGSTRGSTINVEDSSTLMVVDYQFSRTNSGTAPLQDDSSGNVFCGIRASWRWADSGFRQPGYSLRGKLEVALSSFYGNVCSSGFNDPCASDVYFSGANGLIHNSLFVGSEPAVLGAPRLSGNCFSTNPGSFELGPHPSGRVLALEHPCLDGGNAAELEASRQRLLALVQPFAAEPFRAYLSRYGSPNWWQETTLLAGQCTDEGAPDSGRHYPLACEPAP